jgi:hypothetical protein
VCHLSEMALVSGFLTDHKSSWLLSVILCTEVAVPAGLHVQAFVSPRPLLETLVTKDKKDARKPSP